MREKQISLAEKKFILQCLSKRVRIDDRELTEQRKVKIQCSRHTPGTCLVGLGKSKVMIQTNFKIEEPRDMRPNEGRHRIKIEQSTAPIYEEAKNNKTDGSRNNPYSDIIELLEQAFIKSRCLDLESLCIKSGFNSFTIESRLSILSDDGSLPDCCSIAVAVGLKHFKLPTTVVNGDEISINNQNKKSLAIYHLPYLVSFATFPKEILKHISETSSIRKAKNSNTISNLDADISDFCLDPTKLEARFSSGIITLAINKHKELCGMKTHGGICLSMLDIERSYQMALEVVRKNITPALDQALILENQVDEFNLEEIPDFEQEEDLESHDQMQTSAADLIQQIKQEQNYSDDEADIDINNEFFTKQEFDPSVYHDGGLVSREVLTALEEDEWGVGDLIQSVKDGMAE